MLCILSGHLIKHILYCKAVIPPEVEVFIEKLGKCIINAAVNEMSMNLRQQL